MPKNILVITEADVALARRVHDALDLPNRTFMNFREEWKKRPGLPVASERKLRDLWNRVRSFFKPAFPSYYYCGTGEVQEGATSVWHEFEHVRSGSKVVASFPIQKMKTIEDYEADFKAELEAHPPNSKMPYCEGLNKYGFYPKIVERGTNRLLHDCARHRESDAIARRDEYDGNLKPREELTQAEFDRLWNQELEIGVKPRDDSRPCPGGSCAQTSEPDRTDSSVEAPPAESCSSLA